MAKGPKDIKSKQLEQAAFKAGLDFEIPPEVTAAVDEFLAGEPTFTSDPEQAARRFSEQVEQPSLRTFNNEILPGINERFVQRGVRGPAQAGSLFEAGTDLATNLAALRSQFFREDEDRGIGAAEAALGRKASGATARLSSTILPIQLRASLGAQARGAENSQALSGFLNQFLQQQEGQANALAGAIRSGVPDPFRFNPGPSDSDLIKAKWMGLLAPSIGGG